jgi:HK97 family phage prohead protease
MTIELRTESDGTATISGTASLYNTWYRVGGRFEERILPGAATDTLGRNPHVVFVPEHDRSRAVARTPDTLTLAQDGRGLHYRAVVDLADPDARSIVSKIERKVFTESSFAFCVPEGGDSWSDDYTHRTIRAVDIDRGDVSCVPYGASPTTSVQVERAFANLTERRSMAQAISSTGWCGPFITRAFEPRQVTAGYDNDGDAEPCPTCRGSGMVGEGVNRRQCEGCRGTGVKSADDEDDQRREFSAAKRQRLAREGKALPDGSFPIVTVQDLKNAIVAVGRAKDRDRAMAHIRKRARQMGYSNLIPESWGRRSAILVPNDSDQLMAELATGRPSVYVTQAEREAAFMAECRAQHERDWASHPDLVERRQLFSDYARLVR